MKKRRELDALVNGKLGRNKKKKGQHELLRNSESSDVEEFAIPNKPIRIRKHSRSSRLCATCLSACGFFLLLASVIAIVGLVWVHLELKKDVDFLRSQLQKVESGSASNPDEFQELHRKQQELEDIIQEMKSGKTGVQAHEANISKIFHQLQVLNQTTKGLSKSIEAAPDLVELPKRVTELTNQIAGFGSEIQSLTASLEDFKAKTDASLAALEKENDDSTREDSDIPPAVLENIASLSSKIEAMNYTANTKYLEVMGQITKHSHDLERLNTSLINMQGQLQSSQTTSPDEVSQTSSQVQQLISDAVDQLRQTSATKEELQILRNEVRNISSSLQLISTQHDTLTGSSSEVTSADLDNLRNDMNQCCTKCSESMKSFNTTLIELKGQMSSTHEDSGSTETTPEPVRNFIEKRPDPNKWENDDNGQDNVAPSENFPTESPAGGFSASGIVDTVVNEDVRDDGSNDGVTGTKDSLDHHFDGGWSNDQAENRNDAKDVSNDANVDDNYSSRSDPVKTNYKDIKYKENLPDDDDHERGDFADDIPELPPQDVPNQFDKTFKDLFDGGL